MGELHLQETLDTHFMPLRLGATARNTLQEFIDIDVTADDLVRILDHNQAFKAIFYRFVNKKIPTSTKDESSKAEYATHGTTHRLISLLGMIGSRNLILAIRMAKCVDHKFPVDENGDLALQTGELLKNALAFEDLFQRKRLDYPETAFALGCYFDWFLYGQKNNPAMSSLETVSKEIFRRAQRNAAIAYTLAQETNDISPKFALAAGFMIQMGRLHMAFRFSRDADENYINFEKAISENASLNLIARELLERTKFGITHEEMGAYSLFYYDIFKPIWQSVYHYRSPYLLKKADPILYRLATLLGLAESITRSWTIPVDENANVFQHWETPWTKDLKISRVKIISAIKNASALF